MYFFQPKPIFIDSGNNRHVLIGIISFGKECDKGVPGIHTKLDFKATHDWLFEYMSNDTVSIS